MGSSSSSTRLLDGTTYTLPYSVISSNFDEYANIEIRSKRIWFTAGAGVHHGIVINLTKESEYWACEWGTGGKDVYRGTSMCSIYHKTLGKFKIRDIYDAVEKASYGATYGSNYNCNEWTEYVASYLGCSADCRWNGTCCQGRY